MTAHALAVGLLCLGTLASAEDRPDYLVTDGALSDADFYRLVSCRALPGKPCREEVVHWPPGRAGDLRVGFAPVQPGYPAILRDQLRFGLDLAIGAINAVGSGVQLRSEPDPSRQDITIHLVSAPQGGTIAGTGNPGMDGVAIGAALVHIRWNERNEITDGTIAMAADLPLGDAYPILLEELTQSLGLMTDIRNPLYDGVSVFSEDSNDVKKFGPQDRMAIRAHYPET